MPALAQKTEQQYKIGDLVQFVKYDGDAEGELQPGDKLKVTGYDSEQELYNVERVEDGHEDSLFDVEFQAPIKKAGRPTKAKAEVEPEDEEVEEPVKAAKPAKATKATKPSKASVPVEPDDEEVEEPVKAAKPAKAAKSPKAKAAVEPEDEEVEEPVKAAKPAKAKKSVESDDELPDFIETSSVKLALEEHGGDELVTASALAEEKERTIFTLGGVLARIKRNNSFKTLTSSEGERSYEDGLKGFNAYVKEELGVEARSAAYYVDLYEMFSQVTSEEKIAKIGWTKLRELLPLKEVIDQKNVDKWLKKAKESTTKELHDTVTKELVEAGEKAHGNRQMAEQTTFKYVVHNDQANTVVEAITKAKDILGDDCSDGAALIHILTEWLQLSDSE